MGEKVRRIWETNKEWLKQRTAVILCVVMILQILMPNIAVPGIRAFGAETGQEIDLKAMGKGVPADAFSELLFGISDTVTDGNYLSAYFQFSLNNEWLDDQRSELEIAGMLPEQEFSLGQGYQDLREQYQGNYDAYLTAFVKNYKQKHSDFQVPSFTCTVNKDILNVKAVLERVKAEKNIVTDEGNIPIGTWSARETAEGLEFKITMSENVFGHTAIAVKKKGDLLLGESYEENTKADLGAADGKTDLDVKITIHGKGVPMATSSDFSMTKTADQGTNASGEQDPSAINYTITVKATDSDANTNHSTGRATDSSLATGSVATAANDVKTSVATAQAITQDSDEDEDTDGDPENGSYADEIELFNDLADILPLAPTTSRYVRDALRSTSGNASENLLYGKCVADYILESLTLDKVEIKIGNEESWTELDPGKEPYDCDTWEEYLNEHDRVFQYEIGDEIGDAKQLQIRLYTRMADSLWQEYAHSGKLDVTFPNQASLKEGTQTVTVSNQVKPEIKWEELVQKDGMALDVNSSVYQWKVKTNAHFSPNAHLYVLDVIRDVEHSHAYIATDSDYPVKIGEEQLKVHLLTEQELEGFSGENLKFENMTAENVQKLLDAVSGSGTEKETGVAYIYSYEEEDAKTGKTIRNQVMLVPLKNYLNESSTLTYYTKIVPIGEQAGDGVNYNVNISNDVKAVWNWDSHGTGPVPSGDYGSATVGKYFKVKVNLVNKKAGTYDPAARTQTWEFDVNQSGVHAKELTITDILATKSQIWSEELIKDGGTITLKWHDRTSGGSNTGKTATGKDRTVPKVNSKGDAKEDWYLIENSRDEQGNEQSKLTIHLYDIQATDYYKFQIKTRVKDWNFAEGTFTLRNMASYEVTLPNQKTASGTTSAEKTISHERIRKAMVPYHYSDGTESNYDYVGNTVQWRVQINEENLPLEGTVLTDTLPVGTFFDAAGTSSLDTLAQDAKYTGVRAVRGVSDGKGGIANDDRMRTGTWNERQKNDEADIVGRITFGDTANPYTIVVRTENQEGQDGYNHGTLTFTFPKGKLEHMYEFTFVTSVEEAYRKNHIKSTDPNSSNLENKATLTGSVEGNPVKAEVSAVNKANVQHLLKAGIYHKLDNNSLYPYPYYAEDGTVKTNPVGAAYINWTAYVNRTKLSMKNVVVSDSLPDFVELVPASMKICAVTLNPDGSENVNKNPDPGESGNENQSQDENGTGNEIQNPGESGSQQETVLVEHGRICSRQEAAITDFTVDERGFQFKVLKGSAFADCTWKITFDTVLVDDASAGEMTNTLLAKGDDWSDEISSGKAENAADFSVSGYARAKNMYFQQFIKRSEDEVKPTLSGAEFGIRKMKRKGSGTSLADWEETGREKLRVSSSRGTVNFAFLLPGTLYRIREVTPPVGYQRTNHIWYVSVPDGNAEPGTLPSVSGSDVSVIPLSGNSDAINSITVRNAPKDETAGNELKLKKTGRNGIPLSGVTFALWYQNKEIKTQTTDADGLLQFVGMTPLKKNEYYVLKETNPPAGYQTPAGEWRVYVTAARNDSGSADSDRYEIRLEHWLNGTGSVLTPGADGTYEIVNEPVSGGDHGGGAGGEDHGGSTGGEDHGGGTGGEDHGGSTGGGDHGGNTGGGDHGGSTGGGDHGGSTGGEDHGGNTGGSGSHGGSSGGHGGSSSGGSSGGSEGGSSEGPGTVTPPTEPAAPVNPEPQPTEPAVPGETVPAERLPQIPILPDGRPDVEPGSSIEFLDPSDSGGEPLYRGSYDPSENYRDVLEPGEYLMILLDDEVPLAQLLVMIDDEGIPLAVLPKVGDTGLPREVFAAALFLSAAGLGAMFLSGKGQRRRRKSA